MLQVGNSVSSSYQNSMAEQLEYESKISKIQSQGQIVTKTLDYLNKSNNNFDSGNIQQLTKDVVGGMYNAKGTELAITLGQNLDTYI